MKKSILMILLSILSIGGFTISSKAACPTPMDCLGEPFIGPFYRNFALSPTCTLRYEYCYRTATCYPGQTYYDLFIGQLQLIGDCDGFKSDILNNLKTYVQYCHNDVVMNVDPWGSMDNIPECCPPSTSPCWSPFSWRHGNYACYTDWYWDPVSQYWTIDKCDVIDPKSCWDKSRYCWYWESQPSGPPKKKFRYESISYISETNCPETGGINNDLHCHPVCD